MSVSSSGQWTLEPKDAYLRFPAAWQVNGRSPVPDSQTNTKLPRTPSVGRQRCGSRRDPWAPFPTSSFLKFHMELGAGWHPIASEGGFLAAEGPASLSGSPALATVKERLSGSKSRSFMCHLPPARHRAGLAATKWSRTRHSLHPPTAPNVRGIQTLSRKPHQ